jgi:hypothetical protein
LVVEGGRSVEDAMKKSLGILLGALLVAGMFTVALADARSNLRIKT